MNAGSSVKIKAKTIFPRQMKVGGTIIVGRDEYRITKIEDAGLETKIEIEPIKRVKGE